ncbi:MAG TPA: J domain-containing protein [Dehalococcoidia bacterium]|jgi:curved DNA-binding protein|nr:J domain-containing protein [Dehalococcoidia bacterium]
MREARKKAHEKPRQGADVTRKVALSLQEAYSGATRLVELVSGRCFTVQIPPGVDTGTRVRFTGYGKRGNTGGAPGDLYLVIEVRPHPWVERRGNDLDYQYAANLAELALGVKAQIRTLDERLLTLTIPAGTPPGQRFRLVGEGMPRLGQPDERGDLYVTVNMKRPQNLSQRQRKLLEELSRSREGESVASAPDDQPSTEDDIGIVLSGGELLFIALLLTAFFLAGIGTGLLLYGLILD